MGKKLHHRLWCAERNALRHNVCPAERREPNRARLLVVEGVHRERETPLLVVLFTKEREMFVLFLE